MATLARQSTPVGNRLDRTAAHAAVRNLAESYGVDLLPLDLSKDISFTPAPVLRRASEPGGPLELNHSNSIQLDLSSPAALSDPAEATISIGSKSQQGSPAVAAKRATTSCEPDLRGAAREASSNSTGITDAADPPSVAVEQDSAAVDLAGQEAIAAADVGEEAWAEEPEDVEYLSEAEYLEYQIPLEQRISLLEEERDILVDKLLATTEALHASEARNRQSQASASQVGALLEQLQELLRRAEVERDRAKLQLKRQRGSVSQVSGGSSSSAAVARMAAAGPLPHTMSAPVTPAHKLAASSSDSVNSAEAANCSTADTAYPADDVQPLLGDELQMRKKHKSSSEETAHPTCGAEVAAAVASATGGLVSRTPDQLFSPNSLESPVTLTPSTDEARPPVKSVISGFEALVRQRKRSAARKAAAARAAAAAQAAGLEYVPEPMSGSDSGSPKSGSDADAAGLPSEDGADALPSPVPAGGGIFGPEAAADVAQALKSGTRVPPIRVSEGISKDDSSHPQVVNDAAAAAAAVVSAELPSVSAGFSSSLGSPTPTAAALCNANPAGFCSEVSATDDAGSDATSEVVTPSYAQVAARNSREWSVGGRSSKSSSPSPTRRSRVAALSMAGSTQQQQQQCHKSDASSSTGSTTAVGFNIGKSSPMSHSPVPGCSPKAAYSPKSAAAAGHKMYSSSRLGVTPAESVIATAVAEAEVLKQAQQQRQAHVYNPQEFKVGSSGELGSSPDAAFHSAAPAASEPVVEFIAAKQQGQQQHGAAGSKKHQKQKQLQHKLQPKEVASKTPTATEVDCSSAAAAGGGAVASSAAPAGCVAEVLTSGASAAAAPAVNATTAAGKGSDNNSSSPRSHKGKKAKGSIRQSETLAKAAAAVTEAAPAAASDTGAATAAAKPATGVLLKVVVVLLLLCSGGLLYALYQTKSTYSNNTVAHQQMVMSYNWQLKALRDKVGKLERQLTEKDEQLGSCSSGPGSDGDL